MKKSQVPGPTSRSIVIASFLMLLAARGLAEETQATATAATAPVPVAAPVAVQTAAAANPAVKLHRQSQTNVQERLQPSTPDKLIERHGSVGAVFARPEKVKALQLINPFAPREYGGVGESPAAWSWNPSLGPGQAPLPRGFQDDRYHEASAVLFGWGAR
jgi:lysylphosphatidylglycerol synthetase-like protein (DUF2156 family)